MRKHRPERNEVDLFAGSPRDAAGGVKSVTVSIKRSVSQMGLRRTAKTLTKLNQADGFDCMSCAWPDVDPDHRHAAAFYPETNPLVPLDSTALGSNTPTSKSVIIRLAPVANTTSL